MDREFDLGSLRNIERSNRIDAEFVRQIFRSGANIGALHETYIDVVGARSTIVLRPISLRSLPGGPTDLMRRYCLRSNKSRDAVA